MRLLLASVAALAAITLAAPSFAQEAAAPTPTPLGKPKPGTVAYCNTLKSATSKSACLKRVHAQATPKAPTASTTSKSKAKKLDAPKADTSAQMTPPTTPPAAALPPQTI